MKIKLETWKSDQNEEETHLFVSGTNEYVCGFNPKYISFAEIQYMIYNNPAITPGQQSVEYENPPAL